MFAYSQLLVAPSRRPPVAAPQIHAAESMSVDFPRLPAREDWFCTVDVLSQSCCGMGSSRSWSHQVRCGIHSMPCSASFVRQNQLAPSRFLDSSGEEQSNGEEPDIAFQSTVNILASILFSRHLFGSGSVFMFPFPGQRSSTCSLTCSSNSWFCFY